MQDVPRNSAGMDLLNAAFRHIPPGMKGKARLARLVLGNRRRARTAFVNDCFGNRMVIPNLLDSVGLHLWMDGAYEPETLKFLRQHTTSDTVFLDIGANVGVFAVPMARYAKQVVAIEPSPQVLPFLRRNVGLNNLNNVAIIECAASGSDSDSFSLYLPPVSHFGMASSAAQFNVEPITVQAKSLNTILQDQGITVVSVMKIDVEGFEAAVFLGAAKLLYSSSPPPTVFEFCDWAEERAFPGKKGLAQTLLMDAGYQLWTLPDYFRRRPPLVFPITEGAHSIVAIPRSMV
jgi:FkbM family methyltransferase